MRSIILIAVLLSALAAGASERSASLQSQALVALHGGNLQQARELMDRAVAADAGDPFAHYYRAVVRSRMGDSAGAIADLRRALSIKPDLAEARLDLGVALVNAGEYAEAEPLLEEAAREPSLRGNALLFLGIAKLRRGENAASLADFDQVAHSDPSLATTARYYRAVALHRMGRVDEARADFEQVIAEKPDSQLAAEANQFLAGGGPSKPYELYGAFSLDYDSNVVLELDDQSAQSLDVESTDDGSMNLRLGGRYSVWRSENTAVTVGYEFSQRVYLQLDEYNLQGHRPNLVWTARWEDLRFGILGAYDFYLLKDDAYLQRVGGQPWIAWHGVDWGRTEVSYRVRWNDFLSLPPRGVVDGDVASDEDELDSVSHQPRLRQYVYILDPRRYVSASYMYERRDPTKSIGEAFGFNAHEVQVAFGTPLPGDFELYASYAYRHEDYDEGGRVDEPNEIIALVRWPLATWFAVSVGYFGELHNSNQFEYDRHIASVGFDFLY